MKQLTLVALLTLAPTPLPAMAATRCQATADLAEQVDDLAAALLAQPGGVGLSVAVARHGQVLLSRGYGLADAELDVTAGTDTLFRTGSVTKQFTAALVLRLAEQGKLSLDDSLAEHVPAFPLGDRQVSLRQLLQHTSGIRSYTDLGPAWQAVWPLELSDEELLALVEDDPFEFEPGTQWSYSNTGYYLLGMVIEAVSGRTYAEAVQRELCAPLRLLRTRYDSNRELIEDRAQGYALEDGELVNDQPLGMSQPGAAGGLLSTARDLVRWQMALTSGKVVSPESFEQMRTGAVLPGGGRTHYGFGLSLGELEGRPRVQHGGGIFGFNSMLFWLPEEDLHVAVISNGEAVSAARLADDIARAALGLERAATRDEPVPVELLERLPGDYVLVGVELESKVFEREGALMLQATGQPAFRLLWQGGLEFRASFDPQVKLVFADDGQSLTLHQNGARIEGLRKP